MSDAIGTGSHVLLLQDRAGSWRRVLVGTFAELRDLADAVRQPPLGAQIRGARIAEQDRLITGRTVWECVEGSTETETEGAQNEA